MSNEINEEHLSRISTEWELVFRAHKGSTSQIAKAQSELINRYAGAIHRFLLSAVRDPHIAEELDQEFAVRFLRGDFHRADPSRGRFRDFVKRSLRNLMIDYHRRQNARPKGIDAEEVDPPGREIEPQADFEQRFMESWKSNLYSRALEALAQYQGQTGQPFHELIRLRFQDPKMTSEIMAKRISTTLERPVTAGWVRQNLHLARQKFASILVDEVAASLDTPSLDLVEEELADIGLLEVCKGVISKRREAGKI